MERVVERVAGLDVHKDTVVATVRVPGKGAKSHQETHTFGTTLTDLLTLQDWLVSYRVTLVGMEATGVYWKPVYYVLEDTLECWLLNARHLKAVPGRKTDVADSAWIAQLLEHGLVRPSFVPPKPIRDLRDLTRYRKAQIQERSREAQRLDKVLQDAGIKLSSVATDLQGKSARDMLDAMVSGTTDPEVLAEMARGRMRRKLPALREALRGRFRPHHALIVGEIMGKLDYLDEMIERLSEEIGRLIDPFRPAVELLRTIPGVDQRTAEALLGEIGADMSRFASAAHLASWAGMCPGNNASGGRHRSGRTRKGSKWLRVALVESAKATCRTKKTFLSAQYHRLKGRRGHAKATVAVGHSILVIVYHLLSRGEPYTELGAAHYVERHGGERYRERLVANLERMGYSVTLEPTAA
jgi:transposase